MAAAVAGTLRVDVLVVEKLAAGREGEKEGGEKGGNGRGEEERGGGGGVGRALPRRSLLA